MKLFKKQSKEVQKKIPTIRVGTHKKLTIGLWVILIFSITFGIYKNFTAIDRHTTHEKKIIEEKLIDTSSVESYVKEFATTYYSWEQSQEAIDNRNETLKNYLTEELQQLNMEMVRADIPTSSTVQQVQIWKVSKQENSSYQVLFSVTQLITEGETNTSVHSTYQVVIRIDENHNLVIIQNPTISSKPQKSDYQPKLAESDGTVDASTTEEINTFLETFFKLYPKANQEELNYYVSNNALPVINKDYVLAELMNPIYIKEDGHVKAVLSVKYLDQLTKTTQVSQYVLRLDKKENWKIIY